MSAFTFYLYLDWIVLTLVWFERFLHPVKGTWIRMVTYASRGERVDVMVDK